MSLGAGALLAVAIGMVIGWFGGWIARTDENRRWAESMRRRLETAELDAVRAWAEVERVESQRVALPAPSAVPAINIHLTAPVSPTYRDLAIAEAVAVAQRQIPVIEAGVVDG